MSLKDLSVICFGEILMDLFPKGTRPGGAPMNVALHLRNLNVKSGMISRVGKDENGKKLLEFLNSRRVNTELIQRDKTHETGIVRVNIEKKDDPEYTILEKVAWDFINDSFLAAEINPRYIVHGSLAGRSIESMSSLRKLLQRTEAKIVFDLNIRTPFYSKSIIDELLKFSHIVKMDEDEFKMIKEWFYIKNPGERGDFKAIKSLYPNIETLILTKNRKGASVWSNGVMETVKAIPVEITDTVGSGDAFLAAFIHQLDQGADLKDCLRFAAATGAYVASKDGANPSYREKDILPLIAVT